MNEINITAATYYVCGLQGYSLSEALRHWKAKFETLKHFKRDVIKHPSLEPLGLFVAEVWDSVEPITVQEALRESNMEQRRVMFDCIGVAKLFAQLDPELLDRQVIPKTRTRWDEHNKPYESCYEDTYELYRIEGNKLFESQSEWRKPNPVYAVRCWCATTAREYWIYVPEEAAMGKTGDDRKPDAIRAIAWTIRLDISHPKFIYRQGDILIAQESEHSKQVAPYHLTKEDYLKLVISET